MHREYSEVLAVCVRFARTYSIADRPYMLGANCCPPSAGFSKSAIMAGPLLANVMKADLFSSVAYVEFLRVPVCRRMDIIIPPLWSSGQSSWLQIQKSGFDSRRYRIF
jgi:hypothetical protein